MKSIIKNTMILTVITIISGLMLGLVYDVTKEPIAIQKSNEKASAYSKVFPDASSFTEDAEINLGLSNDILNANGYTEQVIDEVLAAKDESGKILGHVMTVTTKEGYGGDIVLSLGITNEGLLNGIEILSINETAGLGMKAAENEFMSQFTNKNVAKFAYVKNEVAADYEIDAISGATITTNAVVNGVNAGIAYATQISVDGGGQNE